MAKVQLLWDKALARRFSEVLVSPLTGDRANETATKILDNYSEFHGVKVEGLAASTILELVQYHVGGVFPNNFIDCIDECMSGARFDGKSVIGKNEIAETISRLSGHIVIMPAARRWPRRAEFGIPVGLAKNQFAKWLKICPSKILNLAILPIDKSSRL